MTMLARAGTIAVASIAIASLGLLAGHALAQPAKLGCTSAPTAQGTQTLHCPTAITIVAESGAKFELGDRKLDDRRAVGSGARDEAGKLVPLDVKAGDRVLFGKWSGTEVKLNGEDLLIMKESDIMGIIG